MSFISNQNKLSKIWISVQDNYNDSENLHRINFNNYPELYTKRILNFDLLKDYKITYRSAIPADIIDILPEKEIEKISRLGYYQIGNVEYYWSNRRITLKYQLDNYPIWMLSYIKILPIFELSDATKDIDNLNKLFSCSVDIESIDDLHHNMIIQCTGNVSYSDEGTKYPDVILNIKLVIINEGWMYAIQHNKT